jgi:hypothetical protein
MWDLSGNYVNAALTAQPCGLDAVFRKLYLSAQADFAHERLNRRI